MVNVRKTVWALLALVAFTPVAGAAPFVEGTGSTAGMPGDAGVIGDAPDTVAMAQPVDSMPAGTPLDSIIGSINVATFADLYLINISNPAAFSATTVGLTGLDTQLFLFNTAGFGIAYNDDAAVGVFQSTLPVGNALYAGLPAGNYVLGISTFDSDPVSAGGQIFPDLFPGVFGPTGPGGGMPQTDFIDDIFSGFGNYQINLTGASFLGPVGPAIPEPGSLALLAIGAGAAVGFGWRRRRKAG